uniref:Envelope glycoprotein n=1 Tax=Oncorhynchus tshawytscha TaxID=74940 RepID=A0AAZ3P1N7_ONCTS
MHKTNSSIPSRLRLIKRDISQYNNVPSDSRRSSKLEKFWRGLIPWYGASENAHELDRPGYHLESLVNLTTEGFSMIRPELQATQLMATQNRVALDMLLAREGGLCQIIGDHCCTFIPQGDDNLTIVVEHLKELRGVLEREHQPDINWNPLGWVQSMFGVWAATIFHWFIYGLILLIALLLIIICVKKLFNKVVDVVLTMPLLANAVGVDEKSEIDGQQSNQIKFIYIALRTSADISKCCTETQPKTPNSKQCRCRSTVARKNSLERPKPRKKPREEPGYVGWPVLFWLCRVEIITEHGQDVQMFINDQHGRIIIRQNS